MALGGHISYRYRGLPADQTFCTRGYCCTADKVLTGHRGRTLPAGRQGDQQRCRSQLLRSASGGTCNVRHILQVEAAYPLYLERTRTNRLDFRFVPIRPATAPGKKCPLLSVVSASHCPIGKPEALAHLRKAAWLAIRMASDRCQLKGGVRHTTKRRRHR